MTSSLHGAEGVPSPATPAAPGTPAGRGDLHRTASRLSPGAGSEPRALGTSPDPVHPLRGRATSHLSDPLDPYAQAGALEREAARLRDELERVRCDVVRMATALAETQPETARRLMALLEDE